MLKFRGHQGCEFFINDDGCIVIKQDSYEFGKEVSIILTPDMAWELHRMIDDNYDDMVFTWADGMVKEPPNA